MMNPVGWFEIYVDDVERAKKFYESVFKVSFESLSDPTDANAQMLAFPSNYEKHGVSGALVKMEGFTAGGNSTIVYFACEDCANEESRVADAGGTIEQSKSSIGEYGYCSLVQDSEGNTIGLHSSK